MSRDTSNIILPSFQGFLVGITGSTGPTGPTGSTGPTGECLVGNTGFGITGIAIVGGNLGITFGSGNTFVSVANNLIRGITGTTSNNNTSFNIHGTTTYGISIIKTIGQVEFNTNSVTYDIQNNGLIEKIKLRGVTFENILFSYSSTGITLTGIAGNTNMNEPQGNTGDLVYIAQVGNNFIFKGAEGNSWSDDRNLITLTTNASKEVNISGYTFTQDNYRAFNVNPIVTEPTAAMSISGFTYQFLHAIPISSISGTTTTQAALYIHPDLNDAPAAKTFQRLYFPQHTAITAGNKTIFSPQTQGITYGSCWMDSIPDVTKRCMEYTTQEYCETYMGGTFSINPCSQRDETFLHIKACCLYDYTINGITCINTFEEECEKFMGIFGNVKCEVFEGIMNKCPDDLCFSCDIGKCCYKGSCFALKEAKCYQDFPGAVWFNEDC